MEVPVGTLIYAELLYAVHAIHYDSLPDYVLVFDVRQGKKWLNRRKKEAFCEQYGFHIIPLVAEGSYTKNDLQTLVPTESAYGPEAEGVVVKRYAKNGYFRGKIVRPEFQGKIDEADGHWSFQKVVRNTLAER